MNLVFIIIGIVILVVAGELLVRGAVNMAYRFHISTLVVGMTVVSFGTSMPELLVSLQASLGGHPGIAMGNVIGSNIANLALVLGLTAIVFPIVVDKNSYKVDWPMLMLSTLMVFAFMWSNVDYYLAGDNITIISFWNGLIMVTLLSSFSVFLIYKSRKKTKAGYASGEAEVPVISTPIAKDIIYIVIGSVGLSYGANLLVEGTIGMASVLGISDYIISVTIVAFGTSLPELMTSVMAAFKRESDLSVGNLIGSNIFNILGILGITAMVKPIPVTHQVLYNDMYWVIGSAFILLPMMLTRKKISRPEGVLLFLTYCGYIFFVVSNK